MSRDFDAGGGTYVDWGATSGVGFTSDLTYCAWIGSARCPPGRTRPRVVPGRPPRIVV